MDLLDPREPVSSWTHGLWLIMAMAGTVLLLWRSRGDRVKRFSFLVYGSSLIFCSAASMLYHGVRASDRGIATFALLDYIGIYLLVAGTYTPIAWNLLRGRWRAGILTLVWTWAAVGAMLHLSWTAVPPWLSTGLYLGMGWGSALCYVEVARRLSFRALLPIPVGGLLYSVGALFNLLQGPVFWPGVFEAHELFHLFVIAASLFHFRFMLTIVSPCQAAIEPASSSSSVDRDPGARPLPSALGSPGTSA